MSVQVTIQTEKLRQFFEEYMDESEMRLYASRTLENRRLFIGNFFWFLEHRGFTECGVEQIRQFFRYLAHGHEEPGGRFGQKHLNRPVRPVTMRDYYNCLRPFFEWIVQRGRIPQSPFEQIPAPNVREEIKMPLSPNQIRVLFENAARSTQPLRDTAILSLLLDTGCRASELISLQLEDVDWDNQCCRVLGKGNKYRTIYFGSKTTETLRNYVQATNRKSVQCGAGSPLFLSTASPQKCIRRMHNGRLTRSGLRQVITRLGRAGGIKSSCSPHALRRTFAVQTLRNGANVFSVQTMLGHTDLQMTRRYCAIAHADVETQHRQYGPVDHLEFILA